MTCVVVMTEGGSAGAEFGFGPERWDAVCVYGGGIVDKLAAGASMDVAVAS